MLLTISDGAYILGAASFTCAINPSHAAPPYARTSPRSSPRNGVCNSPTTTTTTTKSPADGHRARSLRRIEQPVRVRFTGGREGAPIKRLPNTVRAAAAPPSPPRSPSLPHCVYPRARVLAYVRATGDTACELTALAHASQPSCATSTSASTSAYSPPCCGRRAATPNLVWILGPASIDARRGVIFKPRQ